MVSVAAMMKVRHLRDKRRKRSDWTDQPSAPRSTLVKAASSFGACLDEVLEKRVVAAGISWQPRRVKLCQRATKGQHNKSTSPNQREHLQTQTFRFIPSPKPRKHPFQPPRCPPPIDSA